MEHFPKYYTRLFNGVTDALEAMDRHDHIKARDLLIRAQQDAEEMYLEDRDEDDKRPQYTTVDLTPINTETEVPAGELIILDKDKVLEKFRQIARQEETPYPEDEDEDDELSEFTTLDLAPIIAETRKLEMEIELLEADKEFQELLEKVREDTKSYPKPWVREKPETE